MPTSATRSTSDPGPIARFVRARRQALGYTQPQLAERVGTGLRFVRELEAGKPTLRLDKVNQVLAFFGARLAPEPMPAEPEAG